MDIHAQVEVQGFEQLVWCRDAASGLKAIIALHSTRLGPALGGCRMWNYASDAEAALDAMRLARSMTYKAAAAGLPFGGGKAVVIGEPGKGGSAALFRALGRFIERLNGAYITGVDLGTTVANMDRVREETRHVTDTSESYGGNSDFTAQMTAYGVYLGIAASLGVSCADGTAPLKGRTIAVQGLGKVGWRVCEYAHEAGATLIVADLERAKVDAAARRFDAAASPADRIHRVRCDVLAPCALGGFVNAQTLPELRCGIIAGAANNQLAASRLGAELQRAGIRYAPDYVINAGGLIATAADLAGESEEAARRRVERIPETLREIYAQAKAEGSATSEAADRLAERRLNAG